MNITSDPGTSGVVTPFCKDIYGLQFSSEFEPEEYKFEFDNALDEFLANDNPDSCIRMDYETSDDFYKQHQNFRDTIQSIKIFDTYSIGEKDVFIHINIEDDMGI